MGKIPEPPHLSVAQFWNVLTTASHGGPWQACVQLAQRGTLALLSAISSPKTTCTQILSQCLFGDEWHFMKAVYEPQAITPSIQSMSHLPPFSVYLVCYAVEWMQAVSNYNLEMGFINILQSFWLINCWKGLTSYKYLFLPSITVLRNGLGTTCARMFAHLLKFNWWLLSFVILNIPTGNCNTSSWFPPSWRLPYKISTEFWN